MSESSSVLPQDEGQSHKTLDAAEIVGGSGLTMDGLKRIIPDAHHRESFLRLVEHLEGDVAAITALKGHLVLEEKITAAIDKFVFHPEQLEGARLTFAQKLSIARSISLDEHESPVWDLIAKINTLRNVLSHSLNSSSRVGAMNKLRCAYAGLRELEDWEQEEALLILSAVAYCLGFLDAHEQEIERFKQWVGTLDLVVNRHRQARKDEKEANDSEHQMDSYADNSSS